MLDGAADQEKKFDQTMYLGCRPTKSSSSRKFTKPRRFRASAFTVARPVEVMPKTRRPSSLHAKCSRQTSRRGLKSATGVAELGSAAICRTCFAALHPAHEQ